MRFAVIEAGKVVNIAEADVAYAIQQGWVLAGPEVDIGCEYSGGLFTSPASAPLAVPGAVTSRQAKLALLAEGLLDDAEAEVEAAGKAAQIEWFAAEFQRGNPLIAAISEVLGLTSAQVDDLFRAAALL